MIHGRWVPPAAEDLTCEIYHTIFQDPIATDGPNEVRSRMLHRRPRGCESLDAVAAHAGCSGWTERQEWILEDCQRPYNGLIGNRNDVWKAAAFDLGQRTVEGAVKLFICG